MADDELTEVVMAVDLLPGDVVVPSQFYTPTSYAPDYWYHCRILISRSRCWNKRDSDDNTGMASPEVFNVITLHWLTLLRPSGIKMISGDFAADAKFNRLVSPAREK